MGYLISRISKLRWIATGLTWLWICFFDPVMLWIIWNDFHHVGKSKNQILSEINNNNLHEEVWLGSEEENAFVVADDITQAD